MIKNIYDADSRQEEYVLVAAQRIVSFIEEKTNGKLIPPLLNLMVFLMAGKLQACSLDDEQTGQVKELAVFQVREKYFVNRGIQCCVLWRYGDSILDFVGELAKQQGAAEIEYLWHEDDTEVVFKRRAV